MGETLPATPDPNDLAGWSAEDCATYLDSLVLLNAELRTRVGLVLWKWRTVTPDNATFGKLIEPYAAKFGVTVRTLHNWRSAAEDSFGLPPAISAPKGLRKHLPKSKPKQLTIPWAVPHSQDAARIAHDDLAAKLGTGAALSFLRDEISRISGKLIVPVKSRPGKPQPLQANGRGCAHPKAKEDKKPYGTWCGVCRARLR